MKQWVNLKESNDRAEGPRVRFEVQLDQKAVLGVRYRIIADEGNAQYSESERNRNGNFCCQVGAGVGETTNEGVFAHEVTLSAAGGDKFKLEVTKMDGDGRAVESGWVETSRKLYYRVGAMPGVATFDWSAVEATFKKHFIELQRLGDCVMSDEPMCSTDTLTWFERIGVLDEKVAFQTSQKSLGTSIVLVHRLGQRKDQAICVERTLTIPSADKPWQGIVIEVPVEGLSPLRGEPADAGLGSESWFSFDNGTTKTTIVAPLEMKGTSVQVTLKPYNFADVRDPTNDRELVATICIKVRPLAEVRGLTVARTVIVIPTCFEGEECDAQDLQLAVTHEIGHVIGMVPNGGQQALDRPKTFYEGQNHQGPHCSTGATFTPAVNLQEDGTWSGTQGCVMYGAGRLGTGPSALRTPTAFCSGCGELLRKVDVSRIGVMKP
jgi:hypothetical protein